METPKEERPAQKATYDAATSSWKLQFEPKSHADWLEACSLRWEDLEHILVHDPFLRGHSGPGSAPLPFNGKEFYRALDDSSSRLLSSDRSYCVVQRLVRRLADGTKAQDFREVFPIGCTSKFAVIAGAVEAAPGEFHLFRLPIDGEKPPRTEMVRRKQMPVDYDVEKKLGEAFEAPIAEVEPAWDIVPGSQLALRPVSSALDVANGIVAILGEGSTKMDIIETHDVGRRSVIELPRNAPDAIAISRFYVSVAYCRSTATAGDKVIEVPPHVSIHPVADGYGYPSPNPCWKNYVPFKAFDAATQRVLTHMPSCLEFHRSRPEVLLIGTSDGGVITVDCNVLRTTGSNAPDLEKRGPFYAGPNLLETYAIHRKAAELSGGDEKAVEETLRKMPEPARQPVWFVRWTELLQPLGRDAETRMVVGFERAFAVLNGTAKTVRDKFERLGKQTLAYIPRDSPAISMEALGDVLAVHDAATNELIVASLASVRTKWRFNHPDVLSTMTATARPYPSLAMFSKRIVLLYPSGFVLFVEPADDELIAKYEEEQRRLVTEKMAAMKVDSEAKK